MLSGASTSSPELLPLPVESVVRAISTNLTVACPQVQEESYVSNIEWLCYGCGMPESSKVNSGSNHQQTINVRKVIGFGNEGGRMTLLPTVMTGSRRRRQHQRIRMESGNQQYGLQFWPLIASDEGDYFCLVNGRERPSLVTRLLIKGEIWSFKLIYSMKYTS